MSRTSLFVHSNSGVRREVVDVTFFFFVWFETVFVFVKLDFDFDLDLDPLTERARPQTSPVSAKPPKSAARPSPKCVTGSTSSAPNP